MTYSTTVDDPNERGPYMPEPDDGTRCAYCDLTDFEVGGRTKKGRAICMDCCQQLHDMREPDDV